MIERLLAVLLTAYVAFAHAEVQHKAVTYQDGETKLTGYLHWDDAKQGPLQKKLEEAGANWEMVVYGGARHGFTNPDAGSYGIANLKYDPQADRRSWARMQAFFDELF